MTPNFCTIVRDYRNKLFVQFVTNGCSISLLRMLVDLLEYAVADLRSCFVGIDTSCILPVARFFAECCRERSAITFLIRKITISSPVIGLKMSYFSLIRLPSCYRTVCCWIVGYWTVCYRTV